MEFLRNLLPPLKMPRVKKINRETLMNFRERVNCKRISNTILSIATRQNVEESREKAGISTISSLKLDLAASKRNPQSENYGLYALKCDRSGGSQRGVILHIPTKGGSGKKTPDPKEMIHEKFEPCRRSIEDVTAEEAHTFVVAPPRRKRQVKGSKRERLPHSQVMTSTGREAESTLSASKSNLVGNRVKLTKKQSVDIFKLSHSDAFDEFDSIFASVPATSGVRASAKPLKLEQDVGENMTGDSKKVGEQPKTFETTERHFVPNIIVEQCQMSNHLPKRSSRIDRIQFHSEFIPNSFSLKPSTAAGEPQSSAPCNTIDYYIIKSSKRTASSAPDNLDDENNQIWTI